MKTKTQVVSNVGVDLGEIAYGRVYWIGVAWDRDQWRALRNVVMNLLVP
jgi:hypothetical protein